MAHVDSEHKLHEDRQSLWWLAASPTIWAAHFLASYIMAAIWCAKASAANESLLPVRITVGVLTLVALIGIIIVGWEGYRRHDYGVGLPPHDDDTPEDRHRFLGFATLLLSVLSGVA